MKAADSPSRRGPLSPVGLPGPCPGGETCVLLCFMSLSRPTLCFLSLLDTPDTLACGRLGSLWLCFCRDVALMGVPSACLGRSLGRHLGRRVCELPAQGGLVACGLQGFEAITPPWQACSLFWTCGPSGPVTWACGGHSHPQAPPPLFPSSVGH